MNTSVLSFNDKLNQEASSTLSSMTTVAVSLTETIRAMTRSEKNTYTAPSSASDFCSEQIYIEYTKAGRARARAFYASFASTCPMCPQDFVLLALMTLDRFMSTYEPARNTCEPTRTTKKATTTMLIEDCEWYTIVLTVLQLIFKMNMPPGYAPPSLKAYTDSYCSARLSCTPHDVSRMERKVLYELGFHVTPTIYRDYVHYYAELLLSSSSSTVMNNNLIINEVVHKTIDLGRKYSTEVQFMGVKQSVLAFICMRHVLLQEHTSCTCSCTIKESDVLLFEEMICDLIDFHDDNKNMLYDLLLQSGDQGSRSCNAATCRGKKRRCSKDKDNEEDQEEAAIVSDVDSVVSDDDGDSTDDSCECHSRPCKRANTSISTRTRTTRDAIIG